VADYGPGDGEGENKRGGGRENKVVGPIEPNEKEEKPKERRRERR